MNRVAALAVAAALYSVAAWTVKPGFYDSVGAPSYDYVSPPPALAPGNVMPTSGAAVLADGGVVTTHDQPIAQAGLEIPKHGLPPSTAVDIKPYAPPPAGPITLVGNVYCMTANADLAAPAQVNLLIPAAQPFPTAMYFAGEFDSATWTSLGGQPDLSTYLWLAQSTSLGCFALGYPTPSPPQGQSFPVRFCRS